MKEKESVIRKREGKTDQVEGNGEQRRQGDAPMEKDRQTSHSKKRQEEMKERVSDIADSSKERWIERKGGKQRQSGEKERSIVEENARRQQGQESHIQFKASAVARSIKMGRVQHKEQR